MQTLWQDLRFAARMLRKSPGFATVAVVTLAMAIGANALVFSALNGFILRPLNVPHPQSLFQVGGLTTRLTRIPIISICAIATAALMDSRLITSVKLAWTPAKILRTLGFLK